MMDTLTILCALFLIISFTLIKFVFSKSKFDKHGVKYFQKYPIFGNALQLFTQTRHISDILQHHYNGFHNERFIGFYYFGSPTLILKDLHLIKKICVDEFPAFHDHQGYVDDKIDPLFGNNLFSLRGQKWHDMRTTLRCVFTNSALTEIFLLLDKCANHMVNFLGETKQEIELKELFSVFTNDVIASVAFGENIDSFSDVNKTFLKKAKETISQTKLRHEHTKMQILKQVLTTNYSWLMKHFRRPVLSQKVGQYFKNIVLKNVKHRLEGLTIRRPDLIQLMTNIRKNDGESVNHRESIGDTKEDIPMNVSGRIKRDWDDNELTAQAVIFFVSGFETVATFLSFLFYELTIHPEIQSKLQQEIDLHWKKIRESNNTLDYPSLCHMKYLKMVVSEALRLWPPVIIADRRCTNNCEIGRANNLSGKPYTVDVNESIWIPILSIHRDPKYFENPDLFDPERFSQERFGHIEPHTYMPFGFGPRNCIAQKFALLEVKLAVVKILENFNVVKSSNTQIPLKMKKTSLNMQSEKGIYVKFIPREINK